jgi:hypothetical protein
MNPEFVRAALEAAMARLTKPDQLDAGYNGYWVFVDNQWSPGHKGVVGARARADLFAIPVGDPPVRIGLFELEVQEDGLHEAWFFTDNQWPNTDFRLDYIGTLAAWNAAPQWRSGRLPVTQLGWKGFNAEPESTGETLPTAVCLSTTPDVDHATVYGNLVEANGVRVVSHWRSSDGQTLHISPNQDRIWAFVRQNRTLSSPYRPIA